jgi:cell division protein ZapA
MPMAAPRDVDEKPVTLDVAILGRPYKVACRESERAELMEAVGLLDARMREIRDAGKTGGVDRIAVMAALNIANELLRERKSASSRKPAAVDVAALERRIEDMTAVIDRTLAGQEKLFE